MISDNVLLHRLCTLHGVISITQIEKTVIQEFSTSNITVLPPSRFSTSQDIDNISVRKKYIRTVHFNQRNFYLVWQFSYKFDQRF